MVGEAEAPPWLAVDGLLSQFGRRRGEARQRYRRFVAEGVRQESIWTGLRQQIYLGDEEFVRMMQQKVTAADEMTIPRVQIRPPAPSLAVIAQLHAERDEAIGAAYATGARTPMAGAVGESKPMGARDTSACQKVSGMR